MEDVLSLCAGPVDKLFVDKRHYLGGLNCLTLRGGITLSRRDRLPILAAPGELYDDHLVIPCATDRRQIVQVTSRDDICQHIHTQKCIRWISSRLAWVVCGERMSSSLSDRIEYVSHVCPPVTMEAPAVRSLPQKQIKRSRTVTDLVTAAVAQLRSTVLGCLIVHSFNGGILREPDELFLASR
ncbi:hypothetical protein CBL_05536 [Carabus blaptoides fortunei]